MERLTTNIIAEKLDALNALPAGYTPNLDSKWDLLELSREGERKAKRRGYLWLRAAASVVFCSLAFLFWQDAEPEISTAGQKSMRKTEQAFSITPQELPAPLLNQHEAAKPVAVKNKIFEKQLNQFEPQQDVVAFTLHKDSAISEPEPLQELVVQDEPPKKRKARYVQMDFGESDQDLKVQSDFYTHTRFKLFNSGQETHKKESNTASSTAHLRINF